MTKPTASASGTISAPVEPVELDDALVDAHFDHPTDRFFNRELSWLAFNARVLEEAQNPNVPLLERIRFLSISATNLDEFTMVRIAGLKDQIARGQHPLSADGLTPTEQLGLIDARARELQHSQQHAWLALKAALRDEHIEITKTDDLSERELSWLKSHFEANIFPLLTPIAVDPAHPFPFVPNLGMAQVFELKLAGKKAKNIWRWCPSRSRWRASSRLTASAGPLALCWPKM